MNKEIDRSKLTGYPSIDKLHDKGWSFSDRHPVIPDVSIYNALKLLSGRYGKDIAIDCLDLTVTNDELFKNAAKLSRAFKELGIKSGDIIAVSMPNFYQAVCVFFAANRIGAVTTFLNSYAEIDEIKQYLNLYESPIFINYDKSIDYNESIKRDTKVRQVITLNNSDLNTKEFNVDTERLIGYDDFLSFNDMGLVADYYKNPIWTLYNGNQDSLILYTSGTTGNPKSVVLTNKNVLTAATCLKNTSKISDTRGEKSLVCVPFCYPYGFATSTLMSLMCNRTAILAPELSKDNLLSNLAKKPNIIFGSPALLELIKRNTPSEFDLSSVDMFISGGDFLTTSQTETGIEFFNNHGSDIIIYNGSGNAETVGCGTNSVGLPLKINTVGRILLGTDAIIMDENYENELKYGEEGLFCVSGGHVFKEYYNEPELTQKAKFNYKGKTYVKTGTRGILDEEGYFSLTGRDSRFYIMSTLNKVYCDRVQMILSLIDVIDSVAVVKKPNDELLYTSKAYVVLKKGVLPTKEVEQYIKDKCSMQLYDSTVGEYVHLKPYEIPSSFDFVDRLPRTVADKINYPELEKLAKIEYENEKKEIKKLKR